MNGYDHIFKLDDMPVDGKTFENLLLQSSETGNHATWFEGSEDPRLTLDLVMMRSN